MRFELRKVDTPEDIKTLCMVAKQAWHHTYDKLLAPGQVDYMVEMFQSPKAIKEQMENENYMYYLICLDGMPGGLVGFSPRYQGRDEMFLSKLYLLPVLQGSGAARKAIELVVAETHRQGLSIIRLTVNKYNTHAADVYRHYGFETVESVVTDIGNGYVMDDYIMVKKL